VRGVFDSAGPRCARAIAPRVFAFRFAGHRLLPDSQISELNTPPTYTPVQRFKCSLTACPHMARGQVGSLVLPCMTLSFTAPGRFIPTLSLQVCSPPRSSLPLRIWPQGSRGFYVRAYRVSLPPHAPDMLPVRIQAIDGTRTYTLLDSQPCRLLTLLHGNYPASSLIRSSPPLTVSSVLSASRFVRLDLFPYHRQPGSQVPYEEPELESRLLNTGHYMASK
jgi:hypothetical protein